MMLVLLCVMGELLFLLLLLLLLLLPIVEG